MTESGSDENPTSENPPSESVTPPGLEPVDAISAPHKEERALLPRGKSTLRFLIALVVVILVVGGYLLIANTKNESDLAKIQGKVALSAQGLKDVIAEKKLTVYWAGPQAGAKYTLVATTPGIAYVRYLSGGVGLNDRKTLFRAIGTYVQKDAFTVSQTAGRAEGNVGLLNADGDSVFYSIAHPTNVYIGIKGKDIQVEIFDPVVNQALRLVLIRGQISLIN